MSKFKVEEDEKIHLEGRATYIKSSFNVIAGYAFLTSKRFVLCGSTNALINSFSGSPYDSDIVLSVLIKDITNIQEGKHGFTKKVAISTTGSTEYSIQFDPHEKWYGLLKNPSSLLEDTSTVSDSGEVEGEDDGINWHYEENGKKLGPVSTAKMKQFVKNNHTIYRFTNVWRDGMTEWKKADETELSQYFEGPPPLTGDAVDNTIVWILAFAPIIGSFIEGLLTALFASGNFFFITIGLNIILSLLDERKLNQAGLNTRALGLGSAWIVPVYLFKRAKSLNHNLAYFIVWLVTFAITFLI